MSQSTTSSASPFRQPPDDKADQRTACLVRLYPAASGRALVELPPRRFMIGRGAHCDLEIEDPGVSREHATIEPRDGGFVIADLQSTNGTYVNDLAVQEHPLLTGDRLRLGNHIIKFLSGDDIEREYHEAVYSMMIDDALTGVHNKRYLLEVLSRELARSRRHSRALSFVLLDIDHFKRINDTYGHLAGDDVLRAIARRIAAEIRGDEVFARFGGEEFAVVLPEVLPREAGLFAERIRRLVADSPVQVGADTLTITISLGVAHTTGEVECTPENLIHAADQKLYAAKGAGRNRVEV